MHKSTSERDKTQKSQAQVVNFYLLYTVEERRSR